MQHTLQLEAIRDVVTQTFAEHASPGVEFSESVLIRGGFYCGRCYTCDAARAVWFAEENIVKFYGEDGTFLESRVVDGKVVDHQAEQPSQRRAA